jgi:hypothetical protein
MTATKLNAILRRATTAKSGRDTYRVNKGFEASGYLMIDTTYFYESLITAALTNAGLEWEKTNYGIKVAI